MCWLWRLKCGKRFKRARWRVKNSVSESPKRSTFPIWTMIDQRYFEIGLCKTWRPKRKLVNRQLSQWSRFCSPIWNSTLTEGFVKLGEVCVYSVTLVGMTNFIECARIGWFLRGQRFKIATLSLSLSFKLPKLTSI